MFGFLQNLLDEISYLKEMQTSQQRAMCCGAVGCLRKVVTEIMIDLTKLHIRESEETKIKKSVYMAILL